MTTDPARPPFVLLGGVPGAGKTTALRALVHQRADVLVVDPESLRSGFELFFRSVPYRSYRPLLHVLNAVRVLAIVVRGPARARGPLVVHDPATRPRRRRLTARLARARGWVPVLLVIDVSAEEALAGQRGRGRVVPAASFARHWARWQAQRSALATIDGRPVDHGCWREVRLVDRSTVVRVLTDVLGRGQPLDRVIPGSPPSGHATVGP